MNWIIKQIKNKRIEFDYENMELILLKNDDIIKVVVTEYPATAMSINKLSVELWKTE